MKSLLTAAVQSDSAGGAEGVQSPEHHDAGIVCFEETGPGPSHPAWQLQPATRCSLHARARAA